MFCSNCGTQIPDGSKFCPECGAKLNVSSQAPSFQTPKVNEAYQRPVGTSGTSVMDYTKWFMIAAVILMFIGLALPVAKITFLGMSESAHISDFDPSDSEDLPAIILLVLTMIAAVVAVVFQFLPKFRKYGNYTSIGTFALAVIYCIAVKNLISEFGEIGKLGSGSILILIGSVVLLVFGILDLRREKTLVH